MSVPARVRAALHRWGALGIGAGIGAAWGIGAYAGWPFFVFTSAPVSGLAAATAVRVFCGLYPAHRAAALDPIEALRKGPAGPVAAPRVGARPGSPPSPVP